MKFVAIRKIGRRGADGSFAQVPKYAEVSKTTAEQFGMSHFVSASQFRFVDARFERDTPEFDNALKVFVELEAQ